ncbi:MULTISPECIES: carbon-nitrogen family hydrolase [unclassified Bacillus (in: firmicutes)]|uniref:carbon-nitrogen family hydrolase n=1 Tax=unclassified Bacillus (in: firmicutes) TaxID=185979 RepID=UPI001121F161|nr:MULTISPECIES: carbon-nitrogen family hydrolase [unclassified Bacillus (in: firmicutes)]
MKIACVQMDIEYGKPNENFKHVTESISEAAQNGADCIVLPEMWNTGYALQQLGDLADLEGKETIKLLSSLALKYNVNIVGGSVSVKTSKGYFNRMYVFNRFGEVISEYDKAHLFNVMDEHQYLIAGQKENLFKIDGNMSGGLICYDIRFPEWVRKHALAGAKLIFVVAEWPEARVDHWVTLLKARAIENQLFIIAVNRVGKDPNNTFGGFSMVINPWGDTIAIGSTAESILYADLNIQEVDQVRTRISVFEDRREDLYNRKK